MSMFDLKRWVNVVFFEVLDSHQAKDKEKEALAFNTAVTVWNSAINSACG